MYFIYLNEAVRKDMNVVLSRVGIYTFYTCDNCVYYDLLCVFI